MSYLEFFSQIVFHPIAFLDKYFVQGKTSKAYKQKAWFWAFSLWIYLMWFVCVVGILILTFFTDSRFLFLLSIPLFSHILFYGIFRLDRWLFSKSVKWADLKITPEKSKNLYLYIISALRLFSLVSVVLFSIISIVVVYSVPEVSYIIITLISPLYTLVYVIYCVILPYRIINKVAGSISLLPYIGYFIILPLILILSMIFICFGMLFLILYYNGIINYLLSSFLFYM